VQIEKPGNRRAVLLLDEPYVPARVSGGEVQDALCLKVERMVECSVPGLLKVPGNIKRLDQFCQQFAITLATSEFSFRAFWVAPMTFKALDRVSQRPMIVTNSRLGVERPVLAAPGSLAGAAISAASRRGSCSCSPC